MRPPRSVRAVVAAGLLVLTVGCGGEVTPPVRAVPELRAALSEVDSAIAQRHHGQARRQLHKLMEVVQGAREAGELASAPADRILTAAGRLLSALPRPTPAPEPSPTPDAERHRPRQHRQQPPEDGTNEEGKKHEELQKRLEELAKLREELQKKRDEERHKDDGDHSEDDGGGEGEDSDENDSDGKYGGHGGD